MTMHRINRLGVWTMVATYLVLFAVLFWAGLTDRLPMERTMDLLQIMAVVFVPAVLIAAVVHAHRPKPARTVPRSRPEPSQPDDPGTALGG